MGAKNSKFKKSGKTWCSKADRQEVLQVDILKRPEVCNDDVNISTKNSSAPLVIPGKKAFCKVVLSFVTPLENLHEILALLLKFIKISMAEISVQKSRRFLSKASLIKAIFMECKKFQRKKIRYEMLV